MMQWGESLVEKMPRIFLLWLGPLNVGISLHHPETIRPIAKSLGELDISCLDLERWACEFVL